MSAQAATPYSVRSPARRRTQLTTISPHRAVVICGSFFLAALAWSPVLPSVLSIPFSVALLAGFLVLTLPVSNERGVSLRFTLMCGVLLCLGVLFAVIGGSGLLLLRLVPLPLLMFAAWQTTRVAGLPEQLCHLLTLFAGLGVVGAILGFLYALTGGDPVLSFPNIDGRENALYLTTLSNTYFAGIIRPSFIYDEPGAFSFLLCGTVALREVLDRRRWPSYLLLLGGLITFSLTHLLVTLLYLLYRIGPLKSSAIAVVLLAPLATVVSQVEQLEFLVSRFAIEDGRLAGDNRSNQIDNFLEVVHPSMVLFGDVECHGRPGRDCPEHGDISSSPVTPLYRGGIIALCVQLAVHGGLLVAYFRDVRFRFSALALSLMLLQRPYFDVSGYGFITFLLVFLMLRRPASRPAPGPSTVSPTNGR